VGGRSRVALLRGVPPTLERCELSFREREPIDLARARAQHAAYADLLRELGYAVVELAADPAFPDCCFVEDVAVVLDELALLTRPGAESRRGEVAAVAEALARYRPLATTEDPATLEGGDVLRVGRTLYVGRSARTNAAGIARLAAVAEPHGYRVVPVPVSGCLHLKSAVTALDSGRLPAHCRAHRGARLPAAAARRLRVPEGRGRSHLQEPAARGVRAGSSDMLEAFRSNAFLQPCCNAAV
jgi:dimethylargininase